MAYQNGTAPNPTALMVAIENFAVANGFTLSSGSGSWLNKGNVHVRFMPTTQREVTGITRSGSTATATTNGNHGITTGNTVYLVGSNENEYNGQFTVIDAPALNTFRFTVSGTPPTTSVITSGAQRYVLNLSAPSSVCLCMIMGNDSSGTVSGVSQYTQGIYIRSAYWPVSYELFYNGNPDTIGCAITYNTNECQHIQFGDSVKIHASAFTGGWWFSGPKQDLALSPQNGDTYYITLSGIDSNLSGNTEPYFRMNNQQAGGTAAIGTARSFSYRGYNKYYCSTDGTGWGIPITSSEPKILCGIPTISKLFHSPNAWNQQSHLVPILLDYTGDTYRMRLGHLEHIRFIRVDYYNVGDTLTLGTEEWKVYPIWKKNIATRNNASWQLAESSLNTGTIGYAYRKTA